MSAVRHRRIETGTFDAQPLAIGAHRFAADRSGALYWPHERALIVADLHLEKGSSRAARGRLLPPWDTRATLETLGDAIARFRPRTVIALGDSLHDERATQRMAAGDLALLAGLQRGRRWIWLTGNHDPRIGAVMGGESLPELVLDGLNFRHEPGTGGEVGSSRGEIAGHLHPAAKLAIRGTMLRRRCFIGDGARLILPAFGAFTGGLNVLDAAFAPVIAAATRRVLMLGADGVYPVSGLRLRDD